MMDNEAIVDQIVRSLSFEVVAIPQNIFQLDTTSKSTPVNVKIRVRKKHGAVLRNGVLSMPKVDTKSDSRRNEGPERVRLVSSDQTIMNFNVLLEADIDKNHHKQKLNMVSPGLQEKNDDNSDLYKKVNETSPVFTKRSKDIFGRCKPGGCLDPPFGEDKYAYLPTHQNPSLPVSDDSTKLRSSSIFKNGIFRRKKKNSQSDDEFNESDTNNKNKVASKTNLNTEESLEASSSPYSSAIITYPHPSNYNELHKQEDKKVNREDEQSYRNRYSSAEKSKSNSLDEGSYFMIPKKSKNLSNQSDLNKMQNTYTKNRENSLNIVKPIDRTIIRNKNTSDKEEISENVSHKMDESKLTSQDRTYIPVPLIVPLKGTTEVKLSDHELFDIKSETSVVPKKSIVPEKETVNNLDLEVNVEDEMSITEKENYIQNLKSNTPQEISTNIFVEAGKTLYNRDVNREHDIIDESTNIQESENNILNISQHDMLTTEKEILNKSKIDSAIDTIHNLNNQLDFKSHPSLNNVRERSTLDITTDGSDQVDTNTAKKPNVTLMLSENAPFSSQDLKEIYENFTEPLKSTADVIYEETMPPTKDNESNIDHQGEIQNVSKTLFPDHAKLDEAYPDIKNTTEVSPNDTNIINQMKQQDQLQLNKAISETDSQTSPSNTNTTKHSTIDKTAESFFDNTEKNIPDKANEGTKNIFKTFDRLLQEKMTGNNDDMQKYGSDTHIKEYKNDNEHESFKNMNEVQLHKDNVENLNFDITEQKPIENTDNIDTYNKLSSKLNNVDSIDNNIQQLNAIIEPFDDLHVNEVEELAKIAIKNTSLTSSEDDDNITVRGLFSHKRQSVSDQSIKGSGSLTYTQGISSSKQNDKYLKIDLGSDFTEKLDPQNTTNDILKKKPEKTYIKSESPETNTQLENINGPTELNFELIQIPSNNLPEDVYEASNGLQPTSILRTSVAPWKMDISLQSYIDENNERIIKSFDSRDVPKRRENDAFLVARCYLGEDTNEIKMPIDQDNDLSVKVVNVKPQHRTLVEFNDNTKSTDELYGKKKIKIDIPVSDTDTDDEYAANEKLNQGEANRYNKEIMSGDIRNVLNSIYEEELVPLQGIIRGLREEIDALVAYQMKLKVQNLTPKRPKPFRQVHPHKKCSCFRKM